MLTDYHAKYFAHELTKRYPSDSLEKFAQVFADIEAQVDLNPHQVDAALFAFRSPLSKGAILADEVGLGKTIEAGILLSQKWAERKRKILIILPANLRKQWSQELAEKFYLPTKILETASFNEEIKKLNLNPFDSKEIVLCSYQFAKAKEAYIRTIEWDLVVIDEAHRLRNVYKPTNKIGNAIKLATAGSAKLLLTATPLQNSINELFGLVSLIDEHVFGDFKSFRTQFGRMTGTSDNQEFLNLKHRLKPICQRTLRRQVLEHVSYTKRTAIVQEFYPHPDEQTLYDLVSNYLQQDTLYALPVSQRKLMTLILRKLLASSTFAISNTIAGLINRLQAILNKQNAVDLFETMADNFELVPELKETWGEDKDLLDDGGEDSEESEKAEKIYTAQELKEIGEEIKQLNEAHQLAKEIDKNSKGEALLTALQKGFGEAQKLGAPRKAIVFTESRRTQEYLLKHLTASGYENKIVLFNGTNTDAASKKIYADWLKQHANTDKISGSKTADMRAAIVDHFRNTVEIMIATEAAAEGINLQFCSLVVNYDLPWNPQRIEQRIGRCHRYGQKFDVVVINFLNKKNAADVRVYELLNDKFKLFEGVFGASDEVLGAIGSGVDFEKRIVEIYQNCRNEAEIKQAFDELQQDLEPQIQTTLVAARQQLLENFDHDVISKLKMSKLKSQEILDRYSEKLWNLTRYFLGAKAKFSETEKSFHLVENPFAEEQIYPGPYRMTRAVNFDDANIYRSGHPLAQRVLESCKTIATPFQRVTFEYSRSKNKISVLDQLMGKSGWLKVQLLTTKTFEEEDTILLTGCDGDGNNVDSEILAKLFWVDGVPAKSSLEISDHTQKVLSQSSETQIAAIHTQIAKKNTEYFSMEVEKLESWSDDLKHALETNIKELDHEMRDLKKQSKLAATLEEKLKLQKQVKSLESERNAKRRSLFDAQDEIDGKREKLIEEIEARLKHSSQVQELFFVEWKVE